MTESPRALRIAVADDEPDVRQFFREVISRLGHQVAVAATGKELVEHCHAKRPDLVITDIRMPDLDGIAAAQEINRDGPIPVILVTAHHEAETLARAGADYIMAYLTKPVKPVDLQAAINLAMLRFGQFQAVRQEAVSLRQALEDRKTLERAKGAVMKRLQLDESAAFRRMQKLASDTNRKLIELAQVVLKADEVFHSLEER
jgi:response regulator NasT